MRTLYFCPVVSFFFFLLFFLQTGCLPYFYTWCGLSVNSECMSEMCCMRLTGNTGRKNDAKNRHLRTIAQLCRAVSSQLRHVSTIRKKLVKQQYLLHTSSQYDKLWPTNCWDRFRSLGHPSKFQRVSRLAVVTAATSLTRGQPNFAQFLAVSWADTLYIHFRGLLPPTENFARCKLHFTSKSCIHLYWQHYHMALQQRASAELCGMVQGMDLRNFHRGHPTYIQQGGHYVGYQPTV